MNALDDYKRKSGRMFPTCSEILEVIHSIGYVKLTSMELAARNGDQQALGVREDPPGVEILPGQQETNDFVGTGLMVMDVIAPTSPIPGPSFQGNF